MRDAILPADIKTASANQAAKSSDQNHAQDVLMSPQGSYSFNTIKQMPDSDSQGPTNPHPTTSSDPFIQFYQDVLEPAFDTMVKALGKDADDVLNLLNNMSMDNLRLLFADVADGLISVFATIVDGFLKFAEDIIADIVKGISDPMDIPIIGALWEFITGLFGHEEELTALNAISLLVAIPATTIAKLATGTTPDQMDHGFTDANFGATVAAALGQPSPSHASAKFASHPLKAEFQTESRVQDSYVTPESLKKFSQAEGFIGPISGAVASVIDAATFPVGPRGTIAKLKQLAALIKAIFSWPVPANGQNWGSYTARWIAWAIATLAQCAGEIDRKVKVVINGIITVLVIACDWVDNESGLTWTSDICGNVGSLIAECTLTRTVAYPAYALSIVGGDVIALVKAGIAATDGTVNRNMNPGGV